MAIDSLNPHVSLSSIRSRLILLIATAFLPVLAMIILVINQDVQITVARSTEAVSLARSAIKAQSDAALLHMTHILNAIADKTVINAKSSCEGFLENLIKLEQSEFASIGLLNPDASIQCSAFSPNGGGRPLLDIGNDTAVSLQSGNKLHLGAVRVDSISKMPLLLGRLLVRNENQLQAIAVTNMRLDALMPPSLQAVSNATAWLVTPAGERLQLGDTAAVAAVPTPDKKADFGPDGVLVATRQRPFAYAVSNLPDGYRIMVGYRAERDWAEASSIMLRDIAAFAGLALVGLLAVSIGASAAFVRPLVRLNRSVASWRSGAGFEAGIYRRAPREVRVLSQSFKEATDWLRARETQLTTATAQQELLMQEIHHRVKNNLQIVASLLNLQSTRIKVPEARAEFQSARNRVRALATLHRHLYAHGEVHTINMRSFLNELCGQLFQAMGEQEGDRIRLCIEASELRISSDQAVPMALIVTETVSNALQYAFPSKRSGLVQVQLTEDVDVARLIIRDDGIGISDAQSNLEPRLRDGLGLQLIKGFAKQLNAELVVNKNDGTEYRITLPLKRERHLFGKAKIAPAL